MGIAQKGLEYFGGLSNFLVSECGYKKVGQNGNRVKLVCPHHNSKSNQQGLNCYVLDETTFFCHSCGTEGGILKAVSINMGQPSEEDAKKWLADRIGASYSTKKASEESLLDVRKKFVSLAHKFFVEGDFKEVKEYLATRGIQTKMIKRFGIGFVDGWHEISVMRKFGYSDTQLREAGIVGTSKNGKDYSCFKNRIVLMSGGNIYGRAFGSESNLPHLYSKGENSVFNLSCAMPHPDSGETKDIVFVVESIFDAISTQAYINGLHENWAVVATLGTHGVKDDQLLPMLKETKAKEFIIIPDADPWLKRGVAHGVGQKAGLKKARAFEQAGLNIRVMVLPEDSDPNDIAKRRESLKSFRNMVDDSLSVVQYQLYCLSNYFKLDTMEGKQAFLARSKSVLLQNKISLKRELVKYISKISGVEEKELVKFYSATFREHEVMQYLKTLKAKGYSVEDIVKYVSAKI